MLADCFSLGVFEHENLKWKWRIRNDSYTGFPLIGVRFFSRFLLCEIISPIAWGMTGITAEGQPRGEQETAKNNISCLIRVNRRNDNIISVSWRNSCAKTIPSFRSILTFSILQTIEDESHVRFNRFGHSHTQIHSMLTHDRYQQCARAFVVRTSFVLIFDLMEIVNEKRNRNCNWSTHSRLRIVHWNFDIFLISIFMPIVRIAGDTPQQYRMWCTGRASGEQPVSW